MNRKKISFLTVLALALFLFCYASRASAYSSYFTDPTRSGIANTSCADCHGTNATCAGCHSHGTHPDSSKSTLNITAVTDKTSYQPGEAISVTINGGYRSGWVRALLYDQNMNELARSTGTVAAGAGAPSGAPSFPVTLKGTAPATPGTYTFNASWYGNKYDKSGGFFGPRWRPDPNNPNHGEEIVATNSFTVVGTTPPPAPAISVTDSVSPTTDSQVPFGSVNTGSSANQTVTVTNTGTASLMVGAVGSTDPLAAPFTKTNDTCSNQTIAPSASCTMTITFAPTATGTFSDSFNIPSNDPARSSVIVNASGTGAAAPTPAISVTDSVAPTNDLLVPFGTVTAGASAAQTVTVTNNGNAGLVIGAVGSTDSLASPFAVTTDTCSNQTIAPSASCAVTITFAPAATGTFSDSFNIPSNDPGKASVTVSVSGTGSSTTTGDIKVTDSVSPVDDLQIPFGTVSEGRTVDQTVTIENAAGGDLVIGTIASANPLASPFSIATDNCSGKTLSAGSNCTLTVRFTPVAIGTFSDSFDIPSNDPDQPSITMQVNGFGVSSHSNNPPGKPRLRHPADHEEGLNTELDMEWDEVSDPDGDHVNYELRISTDSNFHSPVVVSKTAGHAGKMSGTLFAGTGLGFIFFGVVFAGTARGRKGLLLVGAVVILVGSTLVGCSVGKGSTPLSNAVVSQHVSGLQTATTYYWKVVASDGNGGVTESDVSTFSTK